jgi:hypothetical protein
VIALAVICALQLALVAFLLWERHRADRELIGVIDRLTVRIQAPQRAAIEGLNEQVSALYAPPAVPPDDDDGYWESREELAERLARAEVNGGD